MKELLGTIFFGLCFVVRHPNTQRGLLLGCVFVNLTRFSKDGVCLCTIFFYLKLTIRDSYLPKRGLLYVTILKIYINN